MTARSPLRMLFCVRPSYGHVFPLLPQALACRDAGHAVLFATTGEFAPRLRRLGFEVHHAGITLKQAEDRMWELHPDYADLPREEMWRAWASMFGETAPRATYEDLVPILT